MTFLDFPSTSQSSSSSAKEQLLKSASNTPANPNPSERILNRAPPKIGAVGSSEVLSRVAAFLPQLAASNRAILEKKPEEVNIEVLSGREQEVIEMKLGLGVFEEQKQKQKQKQKQSEKEFSGTDSSDSDSSDSDTESDGTDKRKKIMILPSEIRAAAAKADTNDPFEKVINSLLFFDGSTDDESEEESETSECSTIDEDMENDSGSDSGSDSGESMQILDFE